MLMTPANGYEDSPPPMVMAYLLGHNWSVTWS